MAEWRLRKGQYDRQDGVVESRLPAGVYDLVPTREGIAFVPRPLNTDKLLNLVDSPTHKIIHTVGEFWQESKRFAKYGLLHKRGVLFHGPPGSGKTAAIHLASQRLTQTHDGLTFFVDGVGYMQMALSLVREVEPERPVLIVIEDIDTWLDVDSGEEEQLTTIMDGAGQFNHVLYLATTNHIEKIPPRLRQRPSRFDEVIEIAMPSLGAREQYLISTIHKDDLDYAEVHRWAKDTEGFPLAALRELVVGVKVLGQPYPEVRDRLREMLQVEEPEKSGGSIPEVQQNVTESLNKVGYPVGLGGQ